MEGNMLNPLAGNLLVDLFILARGTAQSLGEPRFVVQLDTDRDFVPSSVGQSTDLEEFHKGMEILTERSIIERVQGATIPGTALFRFKMAERELFQLQIDEAA